MSGAGCTGRPAAQRARDTGGGGRECPARWHGWRVAGFAQGWPRRRTVFSGFRRWQEPGRFDALPRNAAALRRRARSREVGSRLAVVDMHSICRARAPGVPVHGPRGFDAFENVPGRKRAVLVNAESAWLAVAFVPSMPCRFRASVAHVRPV